MQKKVIWIACGGTGGHFIPGVVVGKSLMAQGHQVVFWGEGKKIEENLMKAQEVELERPESGTRWQRLKALWLKMGLKTKEGNPDACLCFGGFQLFCLGHVGSDDQNALPFV